ncbi:MAG TPA: hypothetical protein VMR54_07145 [Thermoanaerobaculia bacterium]|nr:hypothetical protein [Thermoanaerobaculia bacterium]
MLALLVVGPDPAALPEAGSAIEILHAHGADEAVEKLGRNRRIDAVLVLPTADAAEIVAAIREDVVSPPPIFLPAEAPLIPATTRLAERKLSGMLSQVVKVLQQGV